MLRLIGLAVVVGGGLYAANALGIYKPQLPQVDVPAVAVESEGWLDKALEWVDKASEKGGLGGSVSSLAPAAGKFTDRVAAKG